MHLPALGLGKVSELQLISVWAKSLSAPNGSYVFLHPSFFQFLSPITLWVSHFKIIQEPFQFLALLF